MAVFWDMVVVALLSPVANYVNNKKCTILQEHSSAQEREAYALHWVGQTQIYGGFVKRYLGVEDDAVHHEAMVAAALDEDFDKFNINSNDNDF